MKVLVAVAALGLCGCQAQPRSESYFEAHPAEIERVLRGCEVGSHRGPECGAALGARSARERDARMRLYRKSF